MKKNIQINYIALCIYGQLKSWIRHTFQRQSVIRNIFLLGLKSMFYILSWYFKEQLNGQRLGFVKKIFHHNTESVCIEEKEKETQKDEKKQAEKKKQEGKKKVEGG